MSKFEKYLSEAKETKEALKKRWDELMQKLINDLDLSAAESIAIEAEMKQIMRKASNIK